MTHRPVWIRRNRHAAAIDYDRDQADRIAQDLRTVLDGDVMFDAGARALYATDASNFRQVPVGVLRPKHRQDVLRALSVCRRHEVPVLGRGGGTSLAGQCCNLAVVFDFTRHMHRVLELDLENRRARVEPGVVLDDLRTRAQQHGLTFGPDPATHNRCTLGGMIGNNSCGVHAVQSEFYGPGARTEDNLVRVDVALYDGTELTLGETSANELARRIHGSGREAEIYRKLSQLGRRYESLIRERFPQIPRRVSGYNLPAILPGAKFNLARALSGSEGTCAMLLEATVELIDHLSQRVLVVLGYPDVYAAADHIPTIRKFKPVGCEGIDDRLVEDMRLKGLHERDISLLPKGGGWLLVEFGANRKQEALEKAQAMLSALEKEPPCPSFSVIEDAAQQNKLWAVREAGLGATAFVPGQADSWPGWEDSAVAPERVGEYLRALRKLLDQHGLSCSLYGHLAQGCVHTRIDFDFSSSEAVERYKHFTEDAARLVVSMGGTLSGEHGDGQQRGDLLPIMFGDDLMQAFREFKAIWDPDQRMNPGKIIDAYPRDTNLRLGPDYQPLRPTTHFKYPEDGHSFEHATVRCVGIGECRRKSGGTMCPSYMATSEEKHTTRGRAHLLHEMLRGDVITDAWRSEEVKSALELCLSCKGCKGDCPVDVDLATLKAEFLSHYYAGRSRPRYAYAFGFIPYFAPFGVWLSWLVNFATHTRRLGTLAKWAAGIAPERQIPKFARQSFTAWFKRHHETLAEAPRRVVLWPDTFNNHFYPQTLKAALAVLERANTRVAIPDAYLCCGRPLYDYGMLDRAKAHWHSIINALSDQISAENPLVGVEPSCVAAFRDELHNLFPDDRHARRIVENTYTLGEYLERCVPDYDPPRLEGRALLHGHCHHQAIMGLGSEQRLLERMGLEVLKLDSGCCGMAGGFGFEKDKYELSLRIGERVLLPSVRTAAKEDLIVADGFSCREQIAGATDRRGLHVAEVIALAHHQQESVPAGDTPEQRFAQLRTPLFRPSSFVHATRALSLLAVGGLALWWWLS